MKERKKMASFDFNPNTRNYSLENAYWLSRASQLAYENESKISQGIQAWGFNDFKYYEHKKLDTQAFIAGNQEMLMLAFRGTASLKDWMTDINIDLINGPDGKVHEGFSMAISSVWRDIWSFIRNERKGRALWITGHSLGAALATLAVAKLRLEKDEPVNGLYTFGQPRTGDREFQKNFDADFVSQTFRFVYNNDIVARIPFRSMHYSHVGTFKYIDKKGTISEDISWWDIIADRVHGRIEDLLKPGTDGIKDHAIDNYVKFLEKARS